MHRHRLCYSECVYQGPASHRGEMEGWVMAWVAMAMSRGGGELWEGRVWGMGGEGQCPGSAGAGGRGRVIGVPGAPVAVAARSEALAAVISCRPAPQRSHVRAVNSRPPLRRSANTLRHSARTGTVQPALTSDPGYMSRKIRKFRTDKFDTRNKRKF